MARSFTSASSTAVLNVSFSISRSPKSALVNAVDALAVPPCTFLNEATSADSFTTSPDSFSACSLLKPKPTSKSPVLDSNSCAEDVARL